MNCDKYISLIPMERSMKIGMVIHCLQNDDALFEMANEMIRLGKLKGLFEDVTFMPSGTETRNDNPINSIP